MVGVQSLDSRTLQLELQSLFQASLGKETITAILETLEKY